MKVFRNSTSPEVPNLFFAPAIGETRLSFGASLLGATIMACCPIRDRIAATKGKANRGARAVRIDEKIEPDRRSPPGPRILPSNKSGEDRNMVNLLATAPIDAPPATRMAIRKPRYITATVRSFDLAMSPFLRASASFFAVGSWVFSLLLSSPDIRAFQAGLPEPDPFDRSRNLVEPVMQAAA